MKKLFALLALVFTQSVIASAQDADQAPKKSLNPLTKPSRDFVMLQFTYNNWANQPDSVNVGGFGRGFSGYLCYDFPIKKSNFSFAAGLGVNVANVYFQNQQLIFTDTGANQQVRFVNETKDYTKFKIVTTYLEAPFELRYFHNKENRNRGFKAAIGMKVGTLLGAHTKGAYKVPGDGTKIVEKINTRRFIESWEFQPTVRIGWGNFSVVGSYSIQPVFKDGDGPRVFPYSVGICISGL